MEAKEFNFDNDEIDVRRALSTIYRYKFSIIFLMIVMTIFMGTNVYKKKNVYQSVVTIEVGSEVSKREKDDLLSDAIGVSQETNFMTEMDIIKSRELISKAIKKVGMLHRYYTKHSYKLVEYYKNRPFTVDLKDGFNKEFELYPLDENSFRLKLKFKNKSGQEIKYSNIHYYNKWIRTKYFHLKVKLNKKLTQNKYIFIVPEIDTVVNALQSKITVSMKSKDSNILKITYQDTIALRTKEFLDELAKEYIKRGLEEKTKEATQKLFFIEEQLKKLYLNLSQSQDRIELFKMKRGTLNIDAHAKIKIENIDKYRLQLSQIKMDEEILNRIYNRIKKGKGIDTISLAGVKLSDMSISILIRGLQEDIIKKKSLQIQYTDAHPLIIAINKSIKEKKSMIKATLKNLRNSYRNKRKNIEKLIKEQVKILNSLPKYEREYSNLTRKHKVNEKIYSYLLSKKIEAEIAKASTVNKNKILDFAPIPIEPVSPKRKMVTIIGTILGLILGLIYAFVREFFDNRIKTERDIALVTKVPIVALIPKNMIITKNLVIKKEVKIDILNYPSPIFNEAFKTLRTNIELLYPNHRSIVISLTSTVTDEGKVTTAINLASIFSYTNKKVILLNFDLRRSNILDSFGKCDFGINSVLRGENRVEDVIQKSIYNNLDVIHSGKEEKNSINILHTQNVKNIIIKLRELYGIIILVTPPVAFTKDAKIIMSHSDMSLYIVKNMFSKRDYLKNLDEFSKKVNDLGIVLCNIDMKDNQKLMNKYYNLEK
ncbi:Tyrosine-protein kinase EpsD [hydrothermal vent metagenome]|uniref:non-specific protein-tyrosine kinase n=1 Tax=hydrothermal vent metagenome TaxID=652676 RepID=A0A1W1EIQ8_9ZZZZ